MDYKTKPTSLRDIRRYSVILRRLFKVPRGGPFPVLQVLERLSDVFSDCYFIVVEDTRLPPQTMARCVPNNLGGFTIEIKQSVYDGAHEKGIGAFLGFICHEICHIFLFKIGFTPVYERCFADNALPAYCSVEWQAKALCGEVMIPFDESRGMSVDQITTKYTAQKPLLKLDETGKGGGALEGHRRKHCKDCWRRQCSVRSQIFLSVLALIL